jgi:hypothetical protein
MIRTAQRRFAPTVFGITRNSDRHQLGIGDRLRRNTLSSGVTSKPAIEGHFKTGHRRGAQDYRIYTSESVMSQEIFDLKLPPMGVYLLAPGRRTGQRRDATRAPTQGRNGGAVTAAPTSHSGAKAVNPRGMGTESPFHKSSPSLSIFPVLVRQLRGPHLSTWPWCNSRSSMELTAAVSPSSLPQSSTGRLEVSRVLARS